MTTSHVLSLGFYIKTFKDSIHVNFLHFNPYEWLATNFLYNITSESSTRGTRIKEMITD